VHYILQLLKISGSKLALNCCLKFPVFEHTLLVFLEYNFHFHRKFLTEIFKILHFCKHLLTAKILHVTGSCPKNPIVSDLFRFVFSSEELTGTT